MSTSTVDLKLHLITGFAKKKVTGSSEREKI